MSDFPTAAEWRMRQSSLPLAAQRCLLDVKAAKRNRDTNRQREIDEHDAATTAHRAAFEAAVKAALVEAGAEWLAAYRVPDTEVFRREKFDFVVTFDPVHRGLWPIRLTLGFYLAHDGGGRSWGRPDWSTAEGAGWRGASSFLLALERAAELGNPF